MSNHPLITLGASACLLGRKVRFNGGHKRSTFIADADLAANTLNWQWVAGRGAILSDFQPRDPKPQIRPGRCLFAALATGTQSLTRPPYPCPLGSRGGSAHHRPNKTGQRLSSPRNRPKRIAQAGIGSVSKAPAGDVIVITYRDLNPAIALYHIPRGTNYRTGVGVRSTPEQSRLWVTHTSKKSNMGKWSFSKKRLTFAQAQFTTNQENRP